jgi:hypothetical protein
MHRRRDAKAGQSMHQVIQDRGRGKLRVAEVPIPGAESVFRDNHRRLLLPVSAVLTA